MEMRSVAMSKIALKVGDSTHSPVLVLPSEATSHPEGAATQAQPFFAGGRKQMAKYSVSSRQLTLYTILTMCAITK